MSRRNLGFSMYKELPGRKDTVAVMVPPKICLCATRIVDDRDGMAESTLDAVAAG